MDCLLWKYNHINFFIHYLVKNMINKIIKEKRRSMNTAPTRPSNKGQWQGAQEDPKQKQGRV
jgi:hypothetical protein